MKSQSRKKSRLPKIVTELLILIEFAAFFLLAVKLAFVAVTGAYGGFSNADDAPVAEIERLWSNTYEPFVINLFICFLGFALIRLIVVMLWDKIKKSPARQTK